MRKLLVLTVFCALFATAANAQFSAETSTRIASINNSYMSELVLTIPHTSAKTNPSVIGVLKATRGVVFDSYCSHLKTFFIRFDERVINADDIIDSIRMEGLSFPVIEKKQGSIAAVKQHCSK